MDSPLFSIPMGDTSSLDGPSGMFECEAANESQTLDSSPEMPTTRRIPREGIYECTKLETLRRYATRFETSQTKLLACLY